MKTPVFSKLKGYLFLLFFVPFTSLCALSAIVSTYLDRRGGLFQRHGRFWSRLSLLMAGVGLDLHGVEQIPPGPVVFMSNHQGAFDIPALFIAVPCRFAWFAKKELFGIPLFGHALKAAGYIPVDREHGRRTLGGIREAAAAIRSGMSVVIFPEGTRSEDGRLLPFKRGGFLLASLAGVPVVPTVISGSCRISPPRTISLERGTISIRFLPPVATEGKAPDQLLDEVRQIFAEELPSP
jgi:1-acyl-sn-glycerol-3-phosphate acyltransferase